MIYYFIPSSPDKNLGKAYNDYMSLLPTNDDWAVLCDRDTMFLQESYIELIAKAIENNPHAGMFTCYTNRVGDRRQCYKGKINDNPDIRDHKIISDKLKNDFSYSFIEAPISGMIMIIKKEVWQKVGKFKNGMLGVDNDFSHKVENHGYKIVMINGLYVFHYYRLNEGITYKKHLIEDA